MTKETDSAPPRKRDRFLKLAGMTASVAGRYAATRVKEAFQSEDEAKEGRLEAYKRSGERIAETLGELKGAAMKIGQMASIGSDILPRELSDALTKLQKKAPPMPYEAIAAQIERELGSAPELLFESFERTPFASASIGQVHRARVDDGREVVVKVQYPGVDESVDSDLAHLKLALRASGLVNKAHRAGLGRVFEELRERLHEELDYTLEAANVRQFRAFHADHEGIVVPDVVGERSAQRVLTMTYEPGYAISELDEQGFDQDTRDLLGRRLLDAVAAELFELRAIQADPNPANYAFRKDGTVVLYDFGCVQAIHDEVITPYTQLIQASWVEDYDAAEKALIELGVRNPNGPPVEHEFYRRWRNLFLQLYLVDEPFDFSAATFQQQFMRLLPDAMKRLHSFEPPAKLVFIDRTLGGLYGNLKRMGARVPLVDTIHQHIDLPARLPDMTNYDGPVTRAP
ncbi:MAG: putative unusual protein kinase regulating ubiquinone biosynthesis (AarF/ABC1/UbiB family) [Bradymonadia bacterium]|jgi:predicted unusual protein kinase regulating ubiquinone biosynthesis (AarF/ABC1/UbiB family)